MQKIKVRYIVLLLIVGATYIFIAQKIGNKRTKRFYIQFDTTNINGKIEYVKSGYYGDIFKIEGKNDKFVFYPYTNEINELRIFDHIAEKGDTIIKSKYADTLKLIKNGKVYLYTFQKF